MFSRIMCQFFITGSVIVLILGPSLTDSSLSNKKHVKVIIVGAGIAGIGAAQWLLLNNITDVTILEAGSQIGGRIQWVSLGEFGGVDLGGHWIHGQEGNVVYDIAEPLGLVNHSGDYEKMLLFRKDGSELNLTVQYNELINNLLQDIHSRGSDSINKSLKDLIYASLDRYGRSEGLSEKDVRELQHHGEMDLCLTIGCSDISDVSVKASLDYQNENENNLIQWFPGGMDNILNLLMGTHEKSPWKELDIRKLIVTSSRVTKVDWSMSNGPVVVKTESGLTIGADFVIFTPSLNVLKYKHKSLFTPPLPNKKVYAIQALGMDVVNKIYLVFRTRWWPLEVNGFIPLHDSKYGYSSQDWSEGIISFVSEHHNPLVLGAWVTGDAARAMEKASDFEVRTTVMRVLRQRLDQTYKVPEPVFVLRSRWWSNQDVIGSYSYNSVASEKIISPREDLAAPLIDKNGKPSVLFAGEATSTHHYGTVNGALETGWREAQRIIDYVSHERFKSN